MPGQDCVVIRPDATYGGVQGFDYFEGISAGTAGSRGVCMLRLEIPPGGSAEPHLHEDHETAIFVISGRAGMYHGEGLREHLEVGAGEFLYIRRGSRTAPTTRARTSPASPCWPARTRTSRRASSWLRTAGPPTRRRLNRHAGRSRCPRADPG